MITTILKHDIEIIDIHDFKRYYVENLSRFTTVAKKSFLKAVDIPPAYFLEQPETTKETLLSNKEDRINDLEKYCGKCIVILWKDGMALNACRMAMADAEDRLERLSTIEDVEDIVWSKEFYKDGYIQGYIPSRKIDKSKFNKCLVLDFPILLNKPAVLHEAFIKLPNEKSIVDEDLFYYVKSEEADFDQFQHIGLAIEEVLDAIKDNSEIKSLEEGDNSQILRVPEEVLCELADVKVIPSNMISGISSYIESNYEGVTLTVNLLTEILLSYEANLKTIKQVTNLRGCYNFLDNTFNKKDEEIPVEQLIA